MSDNYEKIINKLLRKQNYFLCVLRVFAFSVYSTID